jgi:hypothetical protein
MLKDGKVVARIPVLLDPWLGVTSASATGFCSGHAPASPNLCP